MDGVTGLVAALLSVLRSAVGPAGFPGSWAWAITLFGLVVGLLPAAGAVVVAILRRRMGSRYGAGRSVALVTVGVVSAGLLPWLAFAATARVVRGADDGESVGGLSDADVSEMAEPVPVPFIDFFVGAQGDYLAGTTVAAAFGGGEPGALLLALVLLGLLPLIAAAFVAVTARCVLRRGPGWPSKFFWIPMLAVAVLTAGTPAGASGQLWIGVAGGAFVGIFVALLAGVPSRERVRRSLERSAPSAAPAVPRSRPEASRSQAVPSQAVRTPPRTGAAERRPSLADRMAGRFAARDPEPPLATPAAGTPPTTRHGGPSPTLVAGVPPVRGGEQGRFRLIRRLGEGGFGKVWLAHDTRLGHTVALKAAHAPDADTEQRIEREATALGAVRHPHCVRIHDLVDARSDPGLSELDGMVIVMEYVEGQSLGELVRARGPLDDVAAARVWASVAGALDAAHNKNVFHRDVKPGNVIVDPGGLAHLIDFGIARRTGDATLTMAGFVLGTPDYLAPEIAGGQKATRESDAWQLAATVSFALTGHPPRGAHADAISGLRAAAAGAPLSMLPARSAHLALLHASLDNDPARRPPLREANQALENWLRRTGARPDGPVTVVTSRP